MKHCKYSLKIQEKLTKLIKANNCVQLMNAISQHIEVCTTNNELNMLDEAIRSTLPKFIDGTEELSGLELCSVLLNFSNIYQLINDARLDLQPWRRRYVKCAN